MQNNSLTPEELQPAVDRIVANMASPARVILFGSQARGDADKDSDLDLMVIERELPDKAAEYLRLKAAIGRVGVGVDLLLYSEAEFERRSQVPGTIRTGRKRKARSCMTPQREEAERCVATGAAYRSRSCSSL